MKLHSPEIPHVRVENDSNELSVECDLGLATAYARMRHFKRFSLLRCVLPRDLSS